ncbi:MAG: DUF4382 domain-containing protein [Candidatus Micrarchaeia archaeon]
MNKGGVAAGILLLIIVIVAVAILVQHHKPASTTVTSIQASNQSMLTFQLTDPPEVPNGTQALMISYSSLSAHYTNGNGTSAWASAQASGSINLLSIVNVSQIIGSTNVPINATVDMVRLNITNATITIANTTYNITLPSHQLTVRVANAHKANGTESALIDLTPVVATIYTSNSTIFVLVPSVRAVIVGSKVNSSVQVGAKVRINATERHELELSKPNISIKSASLSQSGNTTYLSVTVVNNANTSVNIKHIMLFGNESVHINYQGITARIENGRISIRNEEHANIGKNEPSGNYGGFGAGASAGMSDNNQGSMDAGLGHGISGQNLSGIMSNFSERFGINASTANILESEFNESELENLTGMNFSGMHGFNMSISEYSDIMEHMNISNATLAKIFNITRDQMEHMKLGISAMHFRVFDFFVAQNGMLMLPFLQGSNMSEYEGEGYTMPAHGSYTFTFTGKLSFANGNLQVSIIPGSTYRINVIGNDGARSSINVTAS